jgi:hypothetical protein
VPVAICPQCCRDYYLPAGSGDECRCEKCDQPLRWLDEVQAMDHSTPQQEPEHSGEDSGG